MTLSVVIHSLAASVFVGGQIVMWAAVAPAARVPDEATRRGVTRVAAGRFGMLSAASLLVLLGTGVFQLTQLPGEVLRGQPPRVFGALLAAKLGLLTLVLVMLGYHVARHAPAIAALSDRLLGGDRAVAGELAAARTRSARLATAMMIVSIAVLALGVVLGQHEAAWAVRR